MARVDVVRSGAVVVVIGCDVVVVAGAEVVVDAVPGEQATMRVTTAETQIGVRRMDPDYGGNTLLL